MKFTQLPVYAHKSRILKALAEHPVIVVESPTGSGKTTQLPIILYEAGYAEKGMIGVTQPRRIATLSVSDFIARQLNTTVPGLVGYKMRFENKTTASTRIKIMTDGILLQEIKGDYTLSEYSVIIVDEAHERSLNIDFVLGLLKRVLELRPNFKVIISSATINAEVFSNYFNDCPIVRIDTPMYPVTVIYDPPDPEQGEEGLLAKIESIVERCVREKRKGDILVFLSGEQQIKDCITLLLSQPYRKKLHILPLYARLSKEEQELVFYPAPRGKTKVIVATNIAETSVTIDGITTVIDSGLAKINYYNPRTFTSSLVEGPISKASCNQRKGRAGRTQPGTCYRLYTKEDFETRPLFTLEEILRTDLSEVVLRMAELGIQDFESFDFISPPPKQGIISAIETLFLLDALNPDLTLSKIGSLMAQFPLIPRHARMIVESILRYPEVIEEVLVAASFLTGNSPFLLPQGEETAARAAHHTFRDSGGDFISYLKIFRLYEQTENKEAFCSRYYLDARVMSEIRNVKEQLALIVSEMGIPVSAGGSVKNYLCAVSKGLIQFVCVRDSKEGYRSLTAERILIHPSSGMYRETPRYIVAGEVVRTSRLYARSVSPLEKGWLGEISPLLEAGLIPLKEKEKVKDREIREKEKARKDTTWQINLGKKIFELKPFKGKKKIALFPWEDLRELARNESLSVPPPYQNIRGKIIFEGLDLAVGERFSNLLKIARFIDAHLPKWDGSVPQKTYRTPEDLPKLVDSLEHLLRVSKVKKGGKRFGFLSLHTDHEGTYWYKPSFNFFTALETSLDSLETLIDELSEIESFRIEQKTSEFITSINRAYRTLSSILE
ncbi:MAG: ATP-dependent RNA helicase [Spirochaetales bacterium]